VKRLLVLGGCMYLPLCYSNGSTTTYTWTGSTSTSMDAPANWDPATTPLSSTDSVLNFQAVSSNYSPNNDIAPNFEFNTIFLRHAYTLTGESFLVPASFGGTLNFTVTGSTIETIMNLGASSAALNIYSTGINTLGNGSGGGLSGNGVVNLLQGQLNLGGTSTFTGTINITGAAGGTILQTTSAGSLGAPILVNLTQPGGTVFTAELNLNGNAQTIGGLSGSTGTTVDLGSANLTFTTEGSYQTPFYGTLTGTGGLILENNANLALMGTNSYTGSTTLSGGASLFTQSLGDTSSFIINGGGGTLQLQLGPSAIMSQNITMNDTTTIATSGGNITYNGTLSGSGTLIKLGRGTLTLSGTTNNTGPVMIEGGTLNVSSSTLPTGAITFQGYGGTLQAASDLTLSQAIELSVPATIDTNGFDVTINGQVSGGAKFIKAGSGTLTLMSGGNNFTGKTMIQGGTLNGTSSTFPATSTGTQQVVFQGAGSGIFQAGSDFPNFASAVILQNNGTIDTNSYDMTLNGVVSGKYNLIKTGAGTLTFGNSGNDFTGNVQINDGTLNATSSTIPAVTGGMPQLVFADTGDGIFQAGSTFTNFVSDVVLQSDGTIDTQSYNMTVSGQLIGEPTYTLHKLGSGKLVFTNQGYFSGEMDIAEGYVHVNGLSAYDMTVRSGATLRGTGTNSGTITIEDGATIAPGNSIGTMTVGTLTLNTGSTTLIEIEADASSRINVTGAATIAGALQIEPAVSPYSRQGSFHILSADSMNGTFASVSTHPGFAFDLSYSANDIYLNYVLAIPTEGLSGNALKVADYLNNHAPPSNEFTQLAFLSGSALKDALNSVSPARNGFATYISAQMAFSLSNVVNTHLDSLRFDVRSSKEDNFTAALTADSSDDIRGPAKNQRADNKYSAWITGFGEYAHQSASLQNPSFHFISEAILAGFDYLPGDRNLVGASLGYAHTHYHEHHHRGHGNINYYFGSLYGNAYMGHFFISPAIWGMFNQTHNTRHISFTGFSQNARADIFAWQLIPHLEIGYDFGFSWGNVVPFTEADWSISWQRSYQEQGASPFNAKQKAHNSSMVRSETGIKFCEKWTYDWGAFLLKEKAAYIFEKPFGTGTVNASFVGTPSSFTVTAVNENLNLGSVGLGFMVAVGKERPVKVDLDYAGEFGDHYWSNELMLTLSKHF
jgi:autotransporter-associated beta strand protein